MRIAWKGPGWYYRTPLSHTFFFLCSFLEGPTKKDAEKKLIKTSTEELEINRFNYVPTGYEIL